MEMSTAELLSIESQELQFLFELKRQISCSLQLLNKSDNYVAFKVKTTNPKKYCVRPNTGVVLPRSTCDVVGTTQAQKEMPPDMQCKDKFLLQSVVASYGATPKDITTEMAEHEAEECKLRVVYVVSPRPPSPVREGLEEGTSPRASVLDNRHLSASEHAAISRGYVERQELQDTSENGLVRYGTSLILQITSLFLWFIVRHYTGPMLRFIRPWSAVIIEYATRFGLYVICIQIRKVLAGTYRKDLMRKIPKFIYDEEKAL